MLRPAWTVAAVIGLTAGVGCKTEVHELRYEGSSTIGMNIMPEAARAFEAKSGVKFTNIGNKGSGEGFKAVMAGTVPIGGMSRDLKEAEKSQRPYYRVIGYDAIAVFVHASNPVADLTKAQVRDIFAGKIANWKDVGGKDAPIEVVTEVKSGTRATIQVFKKVVMGDVDFGQTKEIDKPIDCVRAVAASPNAIAHAALPFLQPNTKAIKLDGFEPSAENVRLGAYILGRPLILVSKGPPAGAAKEFFDFMARPEGQAIVSGADFVPVR